MNSSLPPSRREATTMSPAWCVFSFVLVMSLPSSFAQEEPSRLRCAVPEGWTRSADGKTLTPPGQNVAVVFGPSTPFAGTAEEWIEQYWTGLGTRLEFASEPASATHGLFAVRIAMFQEAGGSPAWLCLHTLVKDGRGESVILVAGTEALFRDHLPVLRRMLGGVTVGAAAGSATSSVPVRPASPPAPNPAPASGAGNLTLGNYDFIPPEHWQVQNQPDQVLLTQSPDGMACRIQILPPQPSSGDLERDARAVFGMMYPSGWQYQKAGEQQYVLSRGFLPRGLEYGMMAASMSATTADGRYQTEDGVALVIRVGEQVAIVAARHGSLMAHVDCLNKYTTWRRFFNSFTVKNAAVPQDNGADVATRIVGVWSQSESRALSEYVFAANGHYAFSGAIGTSWTSTDFNYEYLHTKTYAFAGDGSYSISGDMLTLEKRGRDPDQARFRFEQVNHGGTGWKDRLWLLTRGSTGEVEVCYEKKNP